MPAPLSLTAALEQIHAANIGAAERRRLASRAVALAMGAPAEQNVQAEVADGRAASPFLALHDALDVVAAAAGMKAVTITEAKELLRRQGAPAVAARLSRLSKARNLAAHPDFGLLEDLRCACASLAQARARPVDQLDLAPLRHKTALGTQDESEGGKQQLQQHHKFLNMANDQHLLDDGAMEETGQLLYMAKERHKLDDGAMEETGDTDNLSSHIETADMHSVMGGDDGSVRSTDHGCHDGQVAADLPQRESHVPDNPSTSCEGVGCGTVDLEQDYTATSAITATGRGTGEVSGVIGDGQDSPDERHHQPENATSSGGGIGGHVTEGGDKALRLVPTAGTPLCAELPLWECASRVPLRRLIAGPRDRYLNYIRAQSGARVKCCGKPLMILISADKVEELNTAVRMARDLIASVGPPASLPATGSGQTGGLTETDTGNGVDRHATEGSKQQPEPAPRPDLGRGLKGGPHSGERPLKAKPAVQSRASARERDQR